jgi:hypothetical protein
VALTVLGGRFDQSVLAEKFLDTFLNCG